MTSITMAVAQFAPGPDTEVNVATIERMATEAAARGARVVVFPEYSSFFEADLGPAYVAAAQSLDGAFVGELRRIARDLHVHLVAGLVEAASPEKFSNTLVAVDPAGDTVATYRKLHLYDAFGAKESAWIVPGDLAEPETFDVDGFIVGLQTCYDIRFPEVTRRLVDAGCEIVLLPSEWVRGPLKEHHWRTLVTARAIENTIFIAAADHTPPVGVGNSLIVDPHGVVLASIGDEPGLALAEVRRERLDRVRAQNPALAVRRFRVEPGSPD